MKTLLFVCGPNGIGKTTICKQIIRQLPNSAYVDSDFCRMMNPFVLNDNTIPTVSKNLSDLISNYLSCPEVETVVFSYGFHGRRKEVFDLVMDWLSPYPYRFCPFLLQCDVEENLRRMVQDGRDEARRHWAIEVSRKAYEDVTYPSLDITGLSVKDAAVHLLKMAGVFAAYVL